MTNTADKLVRLQQLERVVSKLQLVYRTGVNMDDEVMVILVGDDLYEDELEMLTSGPTTV